MAFPAARRDTGHSTALQLEVHSSLLQCVRHVLRSGVQKMPGLLKRISVSSKGKRIAGVSGDDKIWVFKSACRYRSRAHLQVVVL